MKKNLFFACILCTFLLLVGCGKKEDPLIYHLDKESTKEIVMSKLYIQDINEYIAHAKDDKILMPSTFKIEKREVPMTEALIVQEKSEDEKTRFYTHSYTHGTNKIYFQASFKKPKTKIRKELIQEEESITLDNKIKATYYKTLTDEQVFFQKGDVYYNIRCETLPNQKFSKKELLEIANGMK